MSLTRMDDQPLTALPTDLAEAARSITSLEAIPVIASADAAGGSPLFYPGGYISWLTSAAASGDYLKLALEHFDPSVAYGLVKILELLIKLAEIRARRRELDKETEEDIIQQLGVIIYKLDEKEAIKHFDALATREGPGRARGLLYDAVAHHLESHTADANILFRRFEKAYTVRNPVARALVQHRFAKSLAATGDFSRSIRRCRATMKATGLPDMIRAQAAREYCNVATQIAWDDPGDQTRWIDLKRAVTCLSDSLEELSNFRGRRAEKQVIWFLGASREEFSVLAEAAGKITKEALKDIASSIDRQCRYSPRTGQNRNTQLAAAYLRIEEFDKAIYHAGRFQGSIKNPLEHGLTHFVKGQGMLGVGKREEATAAIEAASKDFDCTSTTRFRRVLSIYRANLNPRLNRARRLAVYLWPMRGPSRQVGAFVPSISRLAL